MESSTAHGLTVSYNEETLTFTFEWDETTHPEYNFIYGLTEETFAEMVKNYCNKLSNEATNTEEEDQAR